MPQQCKTARRRTRRLIKLPCVLSLRRHYPVPVQTVGDAFGRPLSLVCPSSRQNCVSVSTSIVPLNLTPPTRQVNRPPNVGILNKNRHWVLRGSTPAARPANTPALPRSWFTPLFALPAGSDCSASGRVRSPPFDLPAHRRRGYANNTRNGASGNAFPEQRQSLLPVRGRRGGLGGAVRAIASAVAAAIDLEAFGGAVSWHRWIRRPGSGFRGCKRAVGTW